jgi:phosphoribosylanthranilate isomerase
MKKLASIVAVAIACLGGGYLFIANKAQTAAEEAITEIEREIEKIIPDSDFTFGAVSTDIFSKTVQVPDLALKLNDETLISAHLHVTLGEDERTLSAELTGVEGSSKDNGADFNFSMKSILLTDANIASARTFMDEMDSNPIAAIKALNDISIGGLNGTDLSFTIDVDSEEVFDISGSVELSGIKNGEIEAFNMAGSTSDKYGQIFGASTDGSLKNINITGLDFGNLVAAVAMEDEQLLLAELQTGFGVTAVSIEGLVANIADQKAKLTSGKIKIADNVIENFSLTDFGFTAKDNGADFNFSMKSILLTDANIASARTFMDEMDSNPIAAIKALNDISIGGLNGTDLSFTIDVDSEEVFDISGSVELSGIKNGEIEAFNMAGSTSDKYGQIFGASTDGSLKNINITGLDFGNLVAAVAMEDEQLLLAELQTGFGVTAVSIEGLVANIADQKAKLTSGKIKIADNVIENFSLTDFGFTDADEEIALGIGKAQFKGLNLGFDFLSEKAVLENAMEFYGLTEIGLYDVSYTIEGDEFGIDDLSLTDIALDSGLLVKSTLTANGIRIPIELIAEMDRSVARSIENITDSESFTLSFSNSNDFNTQDGTYDVNLSLGVEGFAAIEINAAYAELDFQRLRRVYKSEDFIEAMDGFSKIIEELSMSSVYFGYTDDQLADVILSQVPDVEQLVMVSDMQIDMFLSQYPDQADQLKASIKAFLEGTNTFKVSMDAEPVVKIMDIPDLFVSGNLTNSISVAFEGN